MEQVLYVLPLTLSRGQFDSLKKTSLLLDDLKTPSIYNFKNVTEERTWVKVSHGEGGGGGVRKEWVVWSHREKEKWVKVSQGGGGWSHRGNG